jgi:glycine/D-amino acid oxidase-like deaminating enzyme
VCFYTVAPGERFVVEAYGRAFLVSACSGHGFKFGPLIGLRLAEAIEGKRRDLTSWAAGD